MTAPWDVSDPPPCEAKGCKAKADVEQDGLDLCRYHATHCECGRELDAPEWWECSHCRKTLEPGVWEKKS